MWQGPARTFELVKELSQTFKLDSHPIDEQEDDLAGDPKVDMVGVASTNPDVPTPQLGSVDLGSASSSIS